MPMQVSHPEGQTVLAQAHQQHTFGDLHVYFDVLCATWTYKLVDLSHTLQHMVWPCLVLPLGIYVLSVPSECTEFSPHDNE